MIGPELIELLATETQWPRSDVAMRYRYLTAVGLLPKGGRGRNAPHLDAIHAAALLTAVLADAPQSGAVEAVRSIDAAGHLDIYLVDGIALSRGIDQIPADAFPLVHGGFLDAVAQIISFHRIGGPSEITAAERVGQIGVISAGGVSRGALDVGNGSGWRRIIAGAGLPSRDYYHGAMRRETWAPASILRKIALNMA